MARTEARTARPPIDRAASFISCTKRIEIGGSGGRGGDGELEGRGRGRRTGRTDPGAIESACVRA